MKKKTYILRKLLNVDISNRIRCCYQLVCLKTLTRIDKTIGKQRFLEGELQGVSDQVVA